MNLNDMRARAYSNNDEKYAPFKGVNERLDEILNAEKTTNSLEKDGLYKVPVPEKKKDSVYRRVAKFLVLIGVDEASKILPLLSAEQTEKIIPEIATIKSVGDDEALSILEEFQGLYKTASEGGGKETARAILEKVYGPEKAAAMIEKVAPFRGNRPFDYLNNAKKERIFHLLAGESGAVKAVVLSNIQPQKAAGVINLMNVDEKTEVVHRLAKMGAVSPEVIKTVDETLRKKALAFADDDSGESIDGRNILTQILKQMDSSAESEILSNISYDDPELALDLKNRLFTLDDIVHADDKFVQETLREYSALDIAMLVAGKPDAFRQKILSCVSSGKRSEVYEEQNYAGRFLKSECERITEGFFKTMKEAYNEGKLIIYGRDDDIYV